MDYEDDTIQKCKDYIQALEEEQRKIQVFQRELPLCLQLVTQTIEAYKQQLSGTITTGGRGWCFNEGKQQQQQQQQSECSEQTTSDGGGPVLEEFIPINHNRRTSSSVDNGKHDDEDDEELLSGKIKISNDSDDKCGKKSDWLRSAQLWNQTTFDSPSPNTNTTKEEHQQPKKVLVAEVNKQQNGAFQPFQKHTTPTASSCSTANEVPPAAPVASAGGNRSGGGCANSGGDDKKDVEKVEGGPRKSRRCWSQDLHRKFLNALQQLGGSHVATPKQIRELMKVDGLTNDEVKSHLQKYRLHNRRPTPTLHHHPNNNPNTQHQFVVVGGIWVPPADYTAAPSADNTTAVTTSSAPNNNRIYTHLDLATTAQQQTSVVCSTRRSVDQKKGSRYSDQEKIGRSNSPATSSSTHTASTIASPVAAACPF